MIKTSCTFPECTCGSPDDCGRRRIEISHEFNDHWAKLAEAIWSIAEDPQAERLRAMTPQIPIPVLLALR